MALLCKADEVLVVGVHVGQLAVDVHHDLLLALLLLLSDENAVILPSAFLFGKQVESWDFSLNHSWKCAPDVGRDDSLSFLS